MKEITIGFRVDSNYGDALRRLAANEGITVSELSRRVLLNWLDGKEIPETSTADALKNLINSSSELKDQILESQKLAALALEESFFAMAIEKPEVMRELKDQIVTKMRTLGISDEMVEMFEERGNELCNSIEKRLKERQ